MIEVEKILSLQSSTFQILRKKWIEDTDYFWDQAKGRDQGSEPETMAAQYWVLQVKPGCEKPELRNESSVIET